MQGKDNPVAPIRPNFWISIASGPRFERLRIIPTSVPQEVHNRYKNACVTLPSPPIFKGEEKLMPCGMRYPEPSRTRPNFFIPILAVGSYVAPFLILLLINAVFHIIPGIPEFRKEIYDLDSGWHVSDLSFAFWAFVALGLPMATGAFTAMLLSKNTRMSLKGKVITWSAIVIPVCVIVCLLVAVVRYAIIDTYGFRGS